MNKREQILFFVTQLTKQENPFFSAQKKRELNTRKINPKNSLTAILFLRLYFILLRHFGAFYVIRRENTFGFGFD